MEPKAEPKAEPKLSRLEELEVEVAQAMAEEFAEIGKLFATDPANAALRNQQLQGKLKSDAKSSYDGEVKVAQEKRDAAQGLVDTLKTAMLADFDKAFVLHSKNALALPFIKRWLVQYDVVEEDGKVTGFKPGVIIAIEPKQIKTGVTKDTSNTPKNGSRITTVDGKQYPSAAQALRELEPDVVIKAGVNAVRELQAKKHTVEIT